jgi:hypothetical protein
MEGTWRALALQLLHRPNSSRAGTKNSPVAALLPWSLQPGALPVDQSPE